jgi:DNA polymerase-1
MDELSTNGLATRRSPTRRWRLRQIDDHLRQGAHRQGHRYAAEDADITLLLWRALKPQLIPHKAVTVYETLERPLVPVLARMERNGIKVDRQMLSRLSGDFAQGMAALEAEIADIAGEDFNVGSPKQLGDILFGKMGLPGGKKTKTGAWATPASALEELGRRRP